MLSLHDHDHWEGFAAEIKRRMEYMWQVPLVAAWLLTGLIAFNHPLLAGAAWLLGATAALGWRLLHGPLPVFAPLRPYKWLWPALMAPGAAGLIAAAPLSALAFVGLLLGLGVYIFSDR